MTKTPTKIEMLYEGKAKKVWTTDAPDELLIEYKDDATALNGKRKETIEGKGLLNNRISNRIFAFLNEQGIPTHFVNEADERNTVVKHAQMIPLEVVVRNIAAGSFSKRLGIAEGQPLSRPAIEFHLKNDELDDPMVSGLRRARLRAGRRIRARPHRGACPRNRQGPQRPVPGARAYTCRLQTRVRTLQRLGHPCRRGVSRHLPHLGRDKRRKAG